MTAPPQWRYWRNVTVLGIGAVAAGVALWYASIHTPAPSASSDDSPPITPDPPTPDPRVEFPTAFRNVKPDVPYVGDAGCAGCHSAIHQKYRTHPMGRSAARVRGDSIEEIERYDKAAHNPFSVGAFELRVEKTTGGTIHRVSAHDAAGAALPDHTASVGLAIGSGTRGRSYLSIRDGAAWQTSISWFTKDHRWDLSPGFDLGTGGRRAISSECLFCHIDHVDPVPGSVNRYHESTFSGQMAIGCERCHGPGGLHKTERTSGHAQAGGMDTSIVNPRHLPPELRTAVCAQCHLQGQERVVRRGRSLHEYRPGLPLEQFVTVFTRQPDLSDAHRSVGQFEQMHRSRCFSGSGGRLTCTTCHNPHETPPAATRDRFYRDRCLTCHETKGCSLAVPERAGKNDSCIACHMPGAGSANIVHASATDHSIPRKPATPAAPVNVPPEAVPLVRFPTGPHGPSDADRERDLGIALGRLANKASSGTRARSFLGRLAADRLTNSLTAWPGDVAARVVLGRMQLGDGETDDALKAAKAAVALAPESEPALALLTDAATAVGQFDVAEGAANALVRMAPTAVDPLLSRGVVFSRKGDWARAEDDCRAALRIHPLHPRARLLLAVCRHRRGDPADGRREAEAAARLSPDPKQRAFILEWYQRETR